MSKETYDVVVLGGGGGGVPAAIRAAQLGGRVAIVESDELGGFCMNRGCIPFGQLMTASGLLGGVLLGKEMGMDISVALKDYALLKARLAKLIAFMREGAKGMLSKNRVQIIRGRGVIAGPGKIEVEGRVLSYRKLILAGGGKWIEPDFKGARESGVINPEGFLSMETLPERVLLYGKSPWLLEIAQFCNRFGSQTVFATEEKRILSSESKSITSRLTKVLRKEGVSILTQSKILSAKSMKDGLHVELQSEKGNQSVIVDRLICGERGALMTGLGLSCVSLDEELGFVRVNAKMESGAPDIYAIGDLTGQSSSHYSNSASEGGIIAAENAMGRNSTVHPKTFSRVLFTQPQVACVGLTPKEAKEHGYDVAIGSAPFGMNPLGMILSEAEGLVEIVTEKKYGEILGMHFVGTGVAEMAGVSVLAILTEATIDELANVPFPHPTLSESLAEAARDALGRAIYLP